MRGILQMRYICLSVIVIALAGCGGSENGNTADEVAVYINDGAVQCEFEGLSTQETAQMLIDAGIDVLNSSCGYINGIAIEGQCGLGDVNINIHTIWQQNLQDAQNLGFESVVELPEGYTVNCS